MPVMALPIIFVFALLMNFLSKSLGVKGNQKRGYDDALDAGRAGIEECKSGLRHWEHRSGEKLEVTCVFQ
jgi:hypothetical protein